MGEDDKDNSLTRKRGWLEKYLVYTSENEAPECYHFWSGITILGHVLGRQTWLARGYFTTFPGQIMTILVGPSGSRKSTAVNIAGKLLKGVPNVNIIANKLSAQSLVDSLMRGMSVENGVARPVDSTGFIRASELSVFIPKQTYVEEIIPIITDIYDAESGSWKYKTRSGGEIVLHNPLITLLGASTPDWLVTNIPANAYGGGFMARVFFVYHEKTTRSNPRPEKNPALERLGKELLASLIWMQGNLKGPFIWTKEAEDWWDDFYVKWQKSPFLNQTGFEAGYYNRRPEHTLRVGMCITASQNHNLILTSDSLEAAHVHLLAMEAEMGRAFDLTIETAQGKEYGRILNFIKKKSFATRAEISHSFWRSLNKNELEMALQTLVEAQQIELVHVGPLQVYKLKD